MKAKSKKTKSIPREQKMESRIKKPARMFMSWKTLVPTIATAVGCYYIGGKMLKKTTTGNLKGGRYV